MQTRAASADQIQYPAFQAAGGVYALGISEVREIITFRSAAPVPMAPSHVMDAINLHGSVVPLIDLARKFELPETSVTKRTCIIIVDVAGAGESGAMGIVVIAVSAVLEVDADHVEQTPGFGLAVSVEYLREMAQIGGRFLPILDLGRVLAADGKRALGAFTEVEGARGDTRSAT